MISRKKRTNRTSSRYPRLIRNWVRGWRKSLIARLEYGENEANVPVVNAIPSRRVLEEPHAAKKRRNGGLKEARRAERRAERGAKREESPRKKERVLSRQRNRRGAFSPSTSAVGNAIGTPTFSRERLFLPIPELEPNGNFLLEAKRHVFRGCTNFRKSQSTRDFEPLVVNIANLYRTSLSE